MLSKCVNCDVSVFDLGKTLGGLYQARTRKDFALGGSISIQTVSSPLDRIDILTNGLETVWIEVEPPKANHS